MTFSGRATLHAALKKGVVKNKKQHEEERE